MLELISCIEHESLPIVEKRLSGQRALGKEHARLLNSLLPALPAKVVKWGHKSVKWSQYCGVIQLDDLTIEVLPKIYGGDSDPGSSREVLIRMLKKAGFLKSHKSGFASMHLQNQVLLDIFILHFCKELQDQLVQGMVRSYVTTEENLPVLRGRLLINEQVKHNLAHRERLYCRYDILSENILLNQIIKFTLKLLLPQARSRRAQKAVIEAYMSFDNIDDYHIKLNDFDKLQLDRTSGRYEPIIEQCKYFIQNLSPDVVSGQAKTISLLFDMNLLFEKWVAAQVRPIAWNAGFKIREQSPQRYLARRLDIDKPVFQMKPDISFIDSDGEVIMIADAKWKILDDTENKLGVSQADMYQLLSYANRYEVKKLLLIYPKQEGLTKEYSFELGEGYKCMVTVVPVDISDGNVEISEFSPLG